MKMKGRTVTEMKGHAVWAWTPKGEVETLVAVFNQKREAEWYAVQVEQDEARSIRGRPDQHRAAGAIPERYDEEKKLGLGSSRPRTH